MPQVNKDWELLREYVERGSEPAFAALVSAHLDMVYSAALRQVRRRELAEEVTQVVFVILARKARSLGPEVVIPGWLHTTTRYTAANLLRVENRRRAHERKAGQMAIEYQRVDSSWEKLAPVLDEGIARLNERERSAIVLRFFQRKSMAETGQALGVSEDAAQMRVSRALAKLRLFFSDRGVALPAAALAGVISANSVQAAPAALGTKVVAHVSAAAHGAATAGASVTLADAVCRGIAVAKAKAAAVVAAGVIGVACAGLIVTQYLVVPLWQRVVESPAKPSGTGERLTEGEGLASPVAVAVWGADAPGKPGG